MKYHLRTIPYLILILSIIISSFLWDKIFIPYEIQTLLEIIQKTNIIH